MRVAGPLLLVLFLSAGCGGGTAGGSGTKVVVTTVDDLAHQAPGITSNESRLSTQLKSLNGGANTVSKDVAAEFQSSDGLVKQIIDATEPGWGFACDAWEKRQTFVRLGAPAGSQTLLETLRQQVEAKTVQELTVDFACAVNKFKDAATG